MKEHDTQPVCINDDFWSPRLEVNAKKAIFHQWEQLEATRCIDNFRIAAGEKEGFREGWFFADSDAYKWLDAAARILAVHPDPALASLVDALIDLLGRAQMEDGYLFTYNQIHFPGQRWVNLQIEHELYCHGHLIEAGVSHHEATGRRDLLEICIKSADLIVHDFLHASSDKTCGHEEIEIALVRLYRVTRKEEYLELAWQFIVRRGRIPLFPIHFYRQSRSHRERKESVKNRRQAYSAKNPEAAHFHLPGDNFAKKRSFSRVRRYINEFLGSYAQQHTPVWKQVTPEGHSVRFGYLETAITKILREKPDAALLSTLEQAWDRMVSRRMYITGGLGSAPEIEGFGRDYELDPEYAYAETCASIASLLWNWEMTLLTKQARYSDLFEWQLYNAANVGMGQHGDTYLYNNPLEIHGGVTRQGWYVVPCCPSNLSRTYADLRKNVYSIEKNNIWIQQFIGSETIVDPGLPVQIRIESEIPWGGRVKIHLRPEKDAEFSLHIRMPSWTVLPRVDGPPTASGYDPRQAGYKTLRRVWSAQGETVGFEFPMDIRLRHAHPRVQGHKDKVAITRGPLVYCLESVDHPGIDIFTARIVTSALQAEYVSDLLGGCVVIHAKTTDGRPLKLIPYFLWGNRGASQMTVWINAG
jgi:uncharacterized protein